MESPQPLSNQLQSSNPMLMRKKCLLWNELEAHYLRHCPFPICWADLGRVWLSFEVERACRLLLKLLFPVLSTTPKQLHKCWVDGASSFAAGIMRVGHWQLRLFPIWCQFTKFHFTKHTFEKLNIRLKLAQLVNLHVILRLAKLKGNCISVYLHIIQ